MTNQTRTEPLDLAEADPFPVALAKAYHEAFRHYLPWPDSLKECLAWERHLAIFEHVAEQPDVAFLIAEAREAARLRTAAEAVTTLALDERALAEAIGRTIRGNRLGSIAATLERVEFTQSVATEYAAIIAARGHR